MANTKRHASYGEVSNAEQLRRLIDSGRTGDKVPVSDPAAAPLGTDEEASGARPTPEQVAAAAQEEMARRLQRPGDRKGSGVLVAAALLAFAVTLAAILLANQ